LNTGCCALFVQLSESRHIRNPERRDVLPSGITVFAFAEIDVRARTAPVADLAGETDIKCTNLSEAGFAIKLRSKPANYRRGKIGLRWKRCMQKGRGGEVYDVAVSDQQKYIRYENITSKPRRFAWQIRVALKGSFCTLKIHA
jgi:hypothetical protein